MARKILAVHNEAEYVAIFDKPRNKRTSSLPHQPSPASETAKKLSETNDEDSPLAVNSELVQDFSQPSFSIPDLLASPAMEPTKDNPEPSPMNMTQ